jgi:hypothetical protein
MNLDLANPSALSTERCKPRLRYYRLSSSRWLSVKLHVKLAKESSSKAVSKMRQPGLSCSLKVVLSLAEQSVLRVDARVGLGLGRADRSLPTVVSREPGGRRQGEKYEEIDREQRHRGWTQKQKRAPNSLFGACTCSCVKIIASAFLCRWMWFSAPR